MFINRAYMRYVGVLLLCGAVFLLAILPTLANGRASTMAAEGLTLVTEDLSGSLTPADLASTLTGSGVEISNVTYTGIEQAAGTFSGGEQIIGFEEGIILGTGDIALVVGPNTSHITSVTNEGGSDSDLDNLSNSTTIDAAVLEFDFVPNQDTIFFQFVFTSEGYNEDVALVIVSRKKHLNEFRCCYRKPAKAG